MGVTAWRIGDEDLTRWLDGLIAAGKRIIGPVREAGLLLFRPVSAASDIVFDAGKAQWSPKEHLFPRTETLYRYVMRPDGPELHDPPPADREQVLFGARGCDAAGLARLDDVFLGGAVVDPFYARRRGLTTVVALSCDEAGPECFCAAVGGTPAGEQGVDLRLVALQSVWLVEPLTKKGEALAAATDATWDRATEEDLARARALEREVTASMTREPLTADQAATLVEAFDDEATWEEVAQRCLGCSVCAYVCPSCSCFDVHQEGDAWQGREVRSWDACTFSRFTLHASGHNPRQGRAAMFRQRLLHKFAYEDETGRAVVRCVGCGRCITLCPAGIDIHEAVARAAAGRTEGETT